MWMDGCVPVLFQRMVDGREDQVTVFLQLVKGFLHCLVYALLNGLTNLINLVDASAGLHTQTLIFLYSLYQL